MRRVARCCCCFCCLELLVAAAFNDRPLLIDSATVETNVVNGNARNEQSVVNAQPALKERCV